MPNWIEGTLKLRGKREDIKRFLDNEIDNDFGQVCCDDGDGYLDYTFKHEPWIKGTDRAFITSDYLYMDDEECSVCLDIKQAWSFHKDDWKDKSAKYNVDIKLFGIECGMEFCQEIIVLRNNPKIVANVITYEDWEWDCPFPNMGG